MKSKIHCLKLDLAYFKDVKNGIKTFEIRKNDRDYQVCDRLLLHLWHKNSYARIVGKENELRIIEKTSEDNADKILARIIYITNYKQKDDYVVLGIKVIK
jgi:hypothetical protein